MTSAETTSAVAIRARKKKGKREIKSRDGLGGAKATVSQASSRLRDGVATHTGRRSGLASAEGLFLFMSRGIPCKQHDSRPVHTLHHAPLPAASTPFHFFRTIRASSSKPLPTTWRALAGQTFPEAISWIFPMSPPPLTMCNRPSTPNVPLTHSQLIPARTSARPQNVIVSTVLRSTAALPALV